jgi:HEAT repeat protein
MSDVSGLIGELLSADEARAEAAALALAQLGEAALPAVLPLFDSPEGETRWWATRVAAGIPGPQAAAALAGALEDDDPAVRQAAALGLRLQPSSDAAAALAQHLADPDPLTARLASDALAALGPAALPHLRLGAHSPQPAMRINAVRSLALLKTNEAIPDLFAALEDSSTLVRHWAERGLEDLGIGMVFFAP